MELKLPETAPPLCHELERLQSALFWVVWLLESPALITSCYRNRFADSKFTGRLKDLHIKLENKSSFKCPLCTRPEIQEGKWQHIQARIEILSRNNLYLHRSTLIEEASSLSCLNQNEFLIKFVFLFYFLAKFIVSYYLIKQCHDRYSWCNIRTSC